MLLSLSGSDQPSNCRRICAYVKPIKNGNREKKKTSDHAVLLIGASCKAAANSDCRPAIARINRQIAIASQTYALLVIGFIIMF